MYGLINSALRSMITENHGIDVWEQIAELANVTEEHFMVMQPYPDDITYSIVHATGKILARSESELMQIFGQYWIGYTHSAGYKEIMDMCGDTLPDFLSSLDDLHTRLGVQFPKFHPPSFECNEISDQTLELHYHSTRQGLAPMVIGLVQGLGERFEASVEISQTTDRNQGDEHDTFLIHYHSD